MYSVHSLNDILCDRGVCAGGRLSSWGGLFGHLGGDGGGFEEEGPFSFFSQVCACACVIFLFFCFCFLFFAFFNIYFFLFEDREHVSRKVPILLPKWLALCRG